MKYPLSGGKLQISSGLHGGQVRRKGIRVQESKQKSKKIPCQKSRFTLTREICDPGL